MSTILNMFQNFWWRQKVLKVEQDIYEIKQKPFV